MVAGVKERDEEDERLAILGLGALRTRLIAI
jgi:hypothetical protein